jgi:thioester reductase-like protein
MALLRMGAISVPLQTSAPVSNLRPIAAETEPVVIASSVEFLDDAVELVLTGHLPQRLVVFDYHGEVDDDRDAVAAATTRLAGNPVFVETLADVLTRGGALPTPPWVERDDGIGLDEYVDWLIEAGFPVGRGAGDSAAWLQRFETAVRALPERQRQASLLPLLHNYQRPETPIRGSIAPTDRFRSAVQDAKIGPDKDIPHVTPTVIVKYITDLQLLGLL